MRYNVIRQSSGAAAIEFAIIAPVFILLICSMIGYAVYLSASHAVQQLTSDAARTAVAGLNRSERQQMATDYISRSASGYAFIDHEAFDVAVDDDPADSSQFTVSISYDASNLPIWNLYAFTMPGREINRSATIRIGGL